MSLTSRKKRPLDRSSKPTRDARLIVVATEGSDTEKIYFETFKYSNVQVLPIPSQNGFSAPAAILQNLIAYKEEYQIGEGDELWVVVDVDRWPEQALSEVARASQSMSFGLAVSNPCFEFWLILHVECELPEDLSSKGLVSALKENLGAFNKNGYDADRLLVNVSSAIQRAEEMEEGRSDRWPQSYGSHCYKLVRSIQRGARV